MPAFAESTPEFIALFQEIMTDYPQTSLRKTFGCPCAYINGHMAAGVFENTMFLRLNPADESEFLQLPGATSFAPMRRPMRGYVIIPEALRVSKEFIQTWLPRALEHAANLPAKEKKPRKKR